MSAFFSLNALEEVMLYERRNTYNEENSSANFMNERNRQTFSQFVANKYSWCVGNHHSKVVPNITQKMLS